MPSGAPSQLRSGETLSPPAPHLIPLPDTDPRLVDLQWEVDDVVQRKHLSIPAGGRVESFVGSATVVLRNALGEASKAPEFVEVVFAAPDQPRPDPMNTFTELPDDRADEPAERPDFLSNVDSRARDLVPGGEDRISHQEGRAQFPQVACYSFDLITTYIHLDG